ncbi:hypothetical protein LZ318_18875 [Saccharopolyspora indica]|uniref:hypothetical protein n=1 Tax=Saccharopolyspora indica TaxID=1229659 RepID=UPI0022EA8F41|nr:hypothetical protein [Saccharopolyspora indica]MDA3645451.1 hypothetical protein [Saccharopolyspora indica]
MTCWGAYTFCVLERFHRCMRRRDIFVEVLAELVPHDADQSGGFGWGYNGGGMSRARTSLRG